MKQLNYQLSKKKFSLHVGIYFLLFIIGCIGTQIDLQKQKELERAIVAGRSEDVKSILDGDASMEYCVENERTPLIIAIDFNRTNVIQVLIDRGVQVDRANSRGDTPLMFAVRGSRLYAVHMLLEAGADPYAKNILGNSSFHMINAGETKGMQAALLCELVKYSENEKK